MFEIEVVINGDYGGFRIIPEIGDYLVNKKNWKVIPETEIANKKNYPIETLIKSEVFGYWPVCDDDDIKLRSHKDLIEAVRSLKDEYNKQKNDGTEKDNSFYYAPIKSFRIEKVQISIEIENYYDGKEKSNVGVNYE